MRNDYYTYAYLREDGTPYYIGKGRGKRAFYKHRRNAPCPPRERILFLKTGLSEEEAFRHEAYLIAVLGRKDLGTGILWNFTDGGEGGGNLSPQAREKIRQRNIGNNYHLGKEHTPEARDKIRQSNLGKTRSQETREKMRQAKLGNKNRVGKKHSPETIEKIRQSNLGKPKVRKTAPPTA